MLLALDVGNTNIVVGCMEGKTPRRTFRLATRRDGMGGDYAAALSQLLALSDISRQDIEQIIISSVVPPVTKSLQHAARLLTGKEPLVLGQNVRYDLPLLIDEPETLGADLLAAAVGALDIHRPPLLLIDMGTATTVAVVDAQGAFRGGAILPGANLSIASLCGNAALLPSIPLSVPEKAIGTNTVTCMQSGCILGAAMLLDGMIERMEAELGQAATVVATGGLASVILPACKHEIIRADDLILRGLAVLYAQNK